MSALLYLWDTEGVRSRITFGTVLSGINVVCGIHVEINCLVFTACLFFH